MLTAEGADQAATELPEALSRARVGVRVMLIGSVGACLQLRASALDADAKNDEIEVRTTKFGNIEVFCAHCTVSTSAAVGIDGLVPCAGCGRTLVVYHHVSRRMRKYFGYQVDAETPA